MCIWQVWVKCDNNITTKVNFQGKFVWGIYFIPTFALEILVGLLATKRVHNPCFTNYKLKEDEKDFFAAFVSTIFAIAAMAQYRPSIIVSAGYQGANVSGVDKSKMPLEARAGVALDFGVYNNGAMELSVQPGLNFSMKGSLLVIRRKVKTSLYYFDASYPCERFASQ